MSPETRWSRRAAERPSSTASTRLRGSLAREVADLRTRLEETTLRSDAYLEAGHPDAAADVIDEQRVLIARFQDRVGAAVAAAQAEHEAEQALAGAPEFAAWAGADAVDGQGPLRGGSRRRPTVGRLAERMPVAAAALLTGLAAVALLLMSSAPPGTQTLSAAGLAASPRPATAPAADASAAAPTAEGGADGTSPERLGRDLSRLLGASATTPPGSYAAAPAAPPIPDPLDRLTDRVPLSISVPEAGTIARLLDGELVELVEGELTAATDTSEWSSDSEPGDDAPTTKDGEDAETPVSEDASDAPTDESADGEQARDDDAGAGEDRDPEVIEREEGAAMPDVSPTERLQGAVE